jgi:Tol biopolymer transport system component
VIASGAKNIGTNGYEVMGIRVSDGVQKTLAQKLRVINGLAWVPDGSALVIAQLGLWQIAYPGGETQKITSDAINYLDVSFSADASTLVSTTLKIAEDIWVVTDEDFSNAKQITSGASFCWFPCWTPDGKIVFSSMASGNSDIWIMQADGTEQKQLTVNEGVDDGPVVSPDGRYIVFVSNRQGATNIWRMEIDGSQPKQLTNGKHDDFPQISPDGKWVVYTATEAEWPTTWKVPIEGGPAVQLVREYSTNPTVSPDGKLLACRYRAKQSDSTFKAAIIPFEGGEPVKLLDIPIAAPRWTPDGRYLSYLNAAGGSNNVWLQPLDGGPPKQLTNFKDHIMGFDWSRDGKLVCSRQVSLRNVVLIKDAR